MPNTGKLLAVDWRLKSSVINYPLLLSSHAARRLNVGSIGPSF